jgi:hypothetical protein
VSRVPFSISRLVQAGHRSSDVSFLLNEGDLARTAAGGPSRKLLREFCKHFAPFCWLLDFQRACGSCSTAAPLKTDSLRTFPIFAWGSSPTGTDNMYARWQVLCRVQATLQQQTSNAAYSIVQRTSQYTTRRCQGLRPIHCSLAFRRRRSSERGISSSS